MNTVVIGVGSNIDPRLNIEKARELLARDNLLISVSSFVNTAPIGYSQQADFINGAFLIRTSLDKNRLKEYLTRIEDSLHRRRTENKNGPRTIDLDIVVWNGTIVDGHYFTRPFLQHAVHEVLPELTANV